MLKLFFNYLLSASALMSFFLMVAFWNSEDETLIGESRINDIVYWVLGGVMFVSLIILAAINWNREQEGIIHDPSGYSGKRR